MNSRTTVLRTGVTVAAISTALVAATIAPAGAQPTPAPPGARAALSATETAEVKLIAENYLHTRATMVTTANPPAARTARALNAVSAPMASRISSEFDALRQKSARYVAADGGYTGAEVAVAVTGTATDGVTATVDIDESTRLRNAVTPAEIAEGAPEFEEFVLPHTLTYHRTADGSWALASDVAHPGDGPTPSTLVTAQPVDAVPANPDDWGPSEEPEAPKDALSSETALPPNWGVEILKPNFGAAYDYDKMVTYANKHWKNYNGSYRKYSQDCTNFVSQIMRAGGWGETGSIINRKKNKVWFYGDYNWSTSYTWAGAENWYWFAKHHSKRTKILDNIWKMAKADVLQLDFQGNNKNIDHTMFVTKTNRGKIYMTYHTTNTHNKSLAKIVADYPRANYYAHRT
ncbi:amidase domain-containing protein [Streptomyces sp. NPDC006798]|uniref:amidase domain-containing protein n=1 Tax=Streptomyces sp. NPDC006798 TaxID=3155462 RepID=UPI0033ED5B6D